MILCSIVIHPTGRGPVMIKFNDNKRWEKTRKMGKWKYIFLVGMLGYGGIMFIVSLFLNRLYLWIRPDTRLTIYLISLIIWLFAGIVFGTLTWFVSERSYKKEKEKWRSIKIDRRM